MGALDNFIKDKRNDPRSNEELIKVALSEKDEDAAWQPVVVLHCRGTHEIFEIARNLCESKIPKERKLGVDILGQLGTPERPFKDETIPILFTLIENEQDIDVLSSVGVSLGHIKDARAIRPLITLKNHTSVDVRFGVVHGLLGQEDDLAIKVLIELSEDEDEDVRDWATFGLGPLIDVDNEEIRDALYNRLSERNDELRGEALVGLARRRDERVVEPLISEMATDCIGTLVIEAAKEIGDSRLHPLLIKLKEWWDVDADLLEEAINSCSR